MTADYLKKLIAKVADIFSIYLIGLALMSRNSGNQGDAVSWLLAAFIVQTIVTSAIWATEN